MELANKEALYRVSSYFTFTYNERDRSTFSLFTWDIRPSGRLSVGHVVVGRHLMLVWSMFGESVVRSKPGALETAVAGKLH